MAYIVLKPTTKKYIYLFNEYASSSKIRLEDCYDKFSYFKERAYYEILEEMNKCHGFAPRILSFNFQYFTMGYLDSKGNIIVETYANTYVLPLN